MSWLQVKTLPWCTNLISRYKKCAKVIITWLITNNTCIFQSNLFAYDFLYKRNCIEISLLLNELCVCSFGIIWIKLHSILFWTIPLLSAMRVQLSIKKYENKIKISDEKQWKLTTLKGAVKIACTFNSIAKPAIKRQQTMLNRYMYFTW